VSYQVQFVEDQALPEGLDWAFATTAEQGIILFVKASRVTAEALTEAWNVWEQRRYRQLLVA